MSTSAPVTCLISNTGRVCISHHLNTSYKHIQFQNHDCCYCS